MSSSKSEFKAEIADLGRVANAYFSKCNETLDASIKESKHKWHLTGEDHDYWAKIPEVHKVESEMIRQQVINLTQKLQNICRVSVLINDADIIEVKIITKKLLALIRLREYFYSAPEAIHDEGSVLGFQPGSQEERGPIEPKDANRAFERELAKLCNIADLTDNETSEVAVNKHSGQNPNAYRQNTAFVMMWMDRSNVDLEDIRDAVVESFKAFGITAVRADDIEHEGVITQRILTEIRTSEFLFADLTGSRPNVYYEVGYAHALGKRVILFKKKGTDLHFDLAGYNCREYINMRDLKDKLNKRLEALTNKTANGEPKKSTGPDTKV